MMRNFSVYSEEIDNLWIHADYFVMAKMLFDKGYDISELDPNNNEFLLNCIQLLFKDTAEIVTENIPLSVDMAHKVDVPTDEFESILKIKPLSPDWLTMNEEQKMSVISAIRYISCSDSEKEFVTFIEEDEIVIATSAYPGPIFIYFKNLMDFANEFLKGENNDNE